MIDVSESTYRCTIFLHHSDPLVFEFGKGTGIDIEFQINWVVIDFFERGDMKLIPSSSIKDIFVEKIW